MASLADVTLSEFKSALTPGAVRSGIIVQLTLAIGVIFFLFAVILINQNTVGDKPVDRDTIEILITIHAVLFVTAVYAGHWLFNRRFSPENLEKAYVRNFVDKRGRTLASTPPEKLVLLIRTGYIMRAALLEGAAFFGLMTLLVAAQSGLLTTQPLLWLNAGSALYEMAFILFNLPTAGKQVTFFEERIQSVAT